MVVNSLRTIPTSILFFKNKIDSRTNEVCGAAANGAATTWSGNLENFCCQTRSLKHQTSHIETVRATAEEAGVTILPTANSTSQNVFVVSFFFFLFFFIHFYLSILNFIF